MSNLRIAVFGAGLVGARHVDHAGQQARLCGIADPSPAAAELAERHGVAHFSDPADCLASARPDGVVIATPNHLHADHAVMCLEQGVPVLLEKPVADTLENADRIVAAGERTGVPVLVGHHRRHNPLIQRARAIIEAGELGDIVVVSGQFWLYKPDDYFQADWRNKAGAGPLLINFIHDIDLLRHLCGEVTELQSMRSNQQRGGAVEDTAAITMRFASGALGSFTLSDTAVAPWSWEMTSGENPMYPHLPTSCYRIAGTHAALSVPDLRLWSHVGPRSWWSEMTCDDRAAGIETGDTLARQFAHFLDVLRGDATPLVSARAGRNALAAVLQCLG